MKPLEIKMRTLWLLLLVQHALGLMEISRINDDVPHEYEPFEVSRWRIIFSGKVTQNKNLTVFDGDSAERFCTIHNDLLWKEMIEMYSNRIVILDISEFEMTTCFPEYSFQYNDYDRYEKWCSLQSTFIVPIEYEPSIRYNEHDNFRDFPDCLFLAARLTDDIQDVLDNPDLEYQAIISVDEPRCATLYSTTPVILLTRVLCGCSFLLTGIYSLVGLANARSGQILAKLVLSINSFVCLYLGILWLLGTQLLSDNVPIRIVNTALTLFSGCNLACDIFMSLRWRGIKHDIVHELPRPTTDNSLIRNHKVFVCFGVLLVLFDFFSIYMFTVMTREFHFFVFVITPLIFLIVVVWVLVYFYAQIKFINRLLASMQISLKTAVVLMQNERMGRAAATRLRVVTWMQRWLRVNFWSILFYWVIFCFMTITNKLAYSCETWGATWSVLALLRCITALGQSVLCTLRQAMASSSRTVAPSTHKSDNK